MSQPTQPDLATTLVSYQAQVQGLRLALEQYIERLWRSLGEYRNAQIPIFTRQVLPAVLGAQQKMSALTAANLAAQEQLALGTRFRPLSIDPSLVTGAASRNGTPPADVYERPFHTVWRELNDLPRESGSIDDAIKAGLRQATTDALTDLQRSKQQTAQQVLRPSRNVTGYRRVLEGPRSCALCIVASTLRYHKDALMPIHGACDCSVEPIYGESAHTVESLARVNGDLVQVGELPDVHERILQRFGKFSAGARQIPDTTDANGRVLFYKDVLITHEHGELGPILGVRGQRWTGPNDL